MDSTPKPMGPADGGASEPEQLGKYRVQSVLGRGAMGVVYKAIDPDIGRFVAIKTLRHEGLSVADDASFSKRFRVEAQAAGRLSHPGIVAVYEFGMQPTIAYIVMEYIDGRSLRDCFEQKTAFSIGQTVDIAAQLLDALAYAHECKVWHRDIKPANVLLTNRQKVKVTDFGIARVDSSLLTQVGEVMGTHGFIAPEMYTGGAVDHRVDLFAVGAVLYQLLAGVPPFRGTTHQMIYQVCCETPVPPSAAAGLTELAAYDAVVMRALSRRPDERFESARAFQDALRAAAAGAATSHDTIITQKLSVDPASTPSSGRAPSTNTLISAGWDPVELDRIEKELMRVFGPISKYLVRKGAEQVADVPQLIRWLADKYPDHAKYQKFVAAMSPNRSPYGDTPSGSDNAVVNAGRKECTSALTTEDVERAKRLLARMLGGPMAPVIVKREMGPRVTREQFVRGCAGYVKNEGDKANFLAAFGAFF